jgi:hypothetical protein
VNAAPSAGASKEARLAKVCERLSKRLDEYKRENEQLEELLVVERQRAQGGAGELSRLEDETATLQAQMGREMANHQVTDFKHPCLLRSAADG